MQRLYRMHLTVLETSRWEVPKSLALCHKQFPALFSRAVPRSFRLKCPPPHWWAVFYAVISVTVAAFQQYRTGKHNYYSFRINRPVQEVFAKHIRKGKFWVFFLLILEMGADLEGLAKLGKSKTGVKDEKQSTVSPGQQLSYQPRMYPHEKLPSFWQTMLRLYTAEFLYCLLVAQDDFRLRGIDKPDYS